MTRAIEFDAASALCKGQRPYQEDAVISDFALGDDVGLVVLADGMGGHAAGDVASKIVVTEVFSDLMFRRGDLDAWQAEMPQSLHSAALAANACLREHVRVHPETRGMGATLVACVVIRRHLYWISVGDSPLYLFRNGVLTQLNEDHSMAPQIDFMVKSGLMAPEQGARHPDRNTLTSVLFGDVIPKVDCPHDPVELEAGDILIVASDGLQFLSDREIEDILCRGRNQSSAEIVDGLLTRVHELGDPELDNVSFSLVKVQAAGTARAIRSAGVEKPGVRCVG